METTVFRRRVFASGAAAVTVGALALAGLSGVASADQAGSAVPAAADRLSPGLIKATSRDLGLGLGADEARARDPLGGTWTAGTSYRAGDRVIPDGVSYRCLQAHSAFTGWEPPLVPALWERG